MAEQKKGSFHALEQRIHQIEEEDAKRDQARGTAERREPGTEAGTERDAQQNPAPTRK